MLHLSSPLRGGLIHFREGIRMGNEKESFLKFSNASSPGPSDRYLAQTTPGLPMLLSSETYSSGQ